MKILHTADLHITEGPRLDDQIRTLGSIAEHVSEHRPDLLIVAGDLYGHTVPHRSTPAERNAVVGWLTRCALTCPVVIVAGNHDAPGDADVLTRLETRHPIHVATAEQAIQSIPIADATIHCIPYPRRTAIAEHLRSIGRGADHGTVQAAGSALLDDALCALADEIRTEPLPGRKHVVVAHLAVVGAATAGGERLAAREVEASTAALDRLTDAGVRYVALGHIHMRQEIARGCWYPGSPHRVSHGETEAQKAVNLVTLDDDYDCDGAQVEALPVWARQFVTVDAHYTAELGWMFPGEFQLDGAEVRLRLHIPEELRTTADRAEVEARVMEAGAHVVTSEIDIVRTDRVRSEEIVTASTDAERLGAYWATLADPPSEDDQRRAIALLDALERGEDIVNQAAAMAEEVLG